MSSRDSLLRIPDMIKRAGYLQPVPAPLRIIFLAPYSCSSLETLFICRNHWVGTDAVM